MARARSQSRWSGRMTKPSDGVSRTAAPSGTLRSGSKWIGRAGRRSSPEGVEERRDDRFGGVLLNEVAGTGHRAEFGRRNKRLQSEPLLAG